MNEQQIALIEQWRLAKQEVDAMKHIVAAERELRKEVFESFFVNPKEGTSTIELQGGWKLKGVFKLDRKLDEAAIPAMCEQLRTIGVNPDTLLEYKASLKMATYKELTEEQRQVFDQALIVKPASPTVDLLPPKVKA